MRCHWVRKGEARFVTDRRAVSEGLLGKLEQKSTKMKVVRTKQGVKHFTSPDNMKDNFPICVQSKNANTNMQNR